MNADIQQENGELELGKINLCRTSWRFAIAEVSLGWSHCKVRKVKKRNVQLSMGQVGEGSDYIS